MSLTGQQILTLAVTATALCSGLIIWLWPRLSRHRVPSGLGRAVSPVAIPDHVDGRYRKLRQSPMPSLAGGRNFTTWLGFRETGGAAAGRGGVVLLMSPQFASAMSGHGASGWSLMNHQAPASCHRRQPAELPSTAVARPNATAAPNQKFRRDPAL
ncbi:hypothetical protein [Streptomyces sp. NPDC048516]|uniref:hypothetical protein n=1 Tax=Streptomyces sp. NPDC048516 TaxID=3365565 RepID=UPI003711A997